MTARTVPELHVLYRLDGGLGDAEHTIDLDGYRGSQPVRVGNSAVEQAQHDIYGALFETAWLYSEGHHALDRDTGAVFARIADHVCRLWCQPDSGIWEVRNFPFHFTHSKVMCWVALDRAVRLADRGELPAGSAPRWRREAEAILAFVDAECWSESLGSYTRVAGSGDVDASLLMLPLVEFLTREARASPAPSTRSTACFGATTSSIAIMRPQHVRRHAGRAHRLRRPRRPHRRAPLNPAP